MLNCLFLLSLIKMKKELYQRTKIPEGVEISINENVVKVKGPEGEVSKKFNFGILDVKVENSEFVIGHKSATKSEKKIMNTITAHIKNMIKGVKEKFEYTLKIASSHFPMTAKIEGDMAIIKNYYGEKTDRKTKIPKGVEISINKDLITIKSCDKELAGQAAANFEMATKVRNRDRRIFQDGVYITKKAGKEI